MASLKELTPLIHAEWLEWKTTAININYVSFYIYLKNNRPELLKFRCNGAPERKIKEIILKLDKSI